MKALISGQADAAVIDEGGNLFWVRGDSLHHRTQINSEQVRYVFAAVTDLEALTDTTFEDVCARLLNSWARDRSLSLFLVLVSPTEDPANRLLSAEALNEIISDQEIYGHLLNLLCSTPLPEFAELDDAADFALTASAVQVATLLETVSAHKTGISAARSAWELLPPSLFQDAQSRASFFNALKQYGGFRLLAFAGGNKSALHQALLTLLADPRYKIYCRSPKLQHLVPRQIFTSWISLLDTSPASSFDYAPDEFDDSIESDRGVANLQQHLERIESQKVAILSKFILGKSHQAHKYIQQLIEYQEHYGGSGFASKSLCDLAMRMLAHCPVSEAIRVVDIAVTLTPYDVRAICQLASFHLRLKEYSTAIDLYEKAIAIEVTPAALNGLAEVHSESRNPLEAVRYYQLAMQHFPEDEVSYCGLANLYKQGHRLREALHSYEDVLKRFPNSLIALTSYAEVLLELGRCEEALKVIENPDCQSTDAIRESMRGEILATLGKFEESLSVYEAASLAFPHVNLLDAKANVLRRAGRVQEALAVFQDAVRKYPYSELAHLGLGETLKELGAFQEALECFEAAKARFPRSSKFPCAKAEALKTMGRFEEAEAEYKATVDAFPESVIAKNGYAGILRDKGDFATAVEHYKLIIARFEDPVAYCGLAACLKDAGDLEQSIGAYRVGLQSFPDHAVARNGLASTLSDVGRYHEALGEYQVSLAANASDVYALCGMGETLRAMGRTKEAFECFTRAVSLTPNGEMPWLGVMGCLLDRNKVGQALNLVQEVLEQQQHFHKLRATEMSCLAKLKRFEELDSMMEGREIKLLSDWIAYYVWAMSLVKRGGVDRAQQMLLHGLEACPWARYRQMFKRGLALVLLRRKQTREARNLLEKQSDDVSNLLKLHVYLENSEIENAETIFGMTEHLQRPLYVRARNGIAMHFGLLGTEEASWTIDKVYDAEVDLLIAA